MNKSEVKLLKSADNMPITLQEWLTHYNDNQGMYHFIFTKNCIIQKNGKRTKDQETEAKSTTKNYTILYSDLEDIKQATLLNVVKYFNRYETTLYKYKYTLYRQALLDALRTHTKQLRRFNMAGNEQQKQGWAQGERIIIDSGDYNSSDLKVDLKRILTAKQYKIVKMILMKYTLEEIAKTQKVTRQAIHKQLQQIRKVIRTEQALNGIAKIILEEG